MCYCPPVWIALNKGPAMLKASPCHDVIMGQTRVSNICVSNDIWQVRCVSSIAPFDPPASQHGIMSIEYSSSPAEYPTSTLH